MNTVFKPIKDGIKSYVRGVGSAIEEAYSKDPKGESESTANKIGEAIFGPLWGVFKFLGEVIKAVMNLINPFLELVSDLIKSVGKFVGDIIKGAMGISGGKDKKIENTLLSFLSGGSEFLINGISSMLNSGSESDSETSPEAQMASALGFVKAFFIIMLCTLTFFNVANTGFWSLFKSCTFVIWGCIFYLLKDELDTGIEKVCVTLTAFYMTGIAFAGALSSIIKGEDWITKLFGAILSIIGGVQLYLIAKYLNDLKPSKIFFGEEIMI